MLTRLDVPFGKERFLDEVRNMLLPAGVGFFFLFFEYSNLKDITCWGEESWGEKSKGACTRCRGHVIRWNGIIRFLQLNQLGHVFRLAVKRSLFTGTPEKDFPLLTCMCAPWAHATWPLQSKIKAHIPALGPRGYTVHVWIATCLLAIMINQFFYIV